VTWRRACAIDGLDAGSVRRFEAGGHDYLIVRTTEGDLLASDISCTHAFAELDTTGALVGHQITCFSHGATFDLGQAGRVVSPTMTGVTPAPLRTFPTRVEGGIVLADIPDDDHPPTPPF